jgi:hypothetical protein
MKRGEIPARGDEGSIRFDIYLVLFLDYEIVKNLISGVLLPTIPRSPHQGIGP